MIIKSHSYDGTLGGAYIKYINSIELRFTFICGFGYEYRDYKNLFEPNALTIKTIFLPFISIAFSRMVIRKVQPE